MLPQYNQFDYNPPVQQHLHQQMYPQLTWAVHSRYSCGFYKQKPPNPLPEDETTHMYGLQFLVLHQQFLHLSKVLYWGFHPGFLKANIFQFYSHSSGHFHDHPSYNMIPDRQSFLHHIHHSTNQHEAQHFLFGEGAQNETLYHQHMCPLASILARYGYLYSWPGSL